MLNEQDKDELHRLNHTERKVVFKQQLDRIHAAVNDGTLDRDTVNDALERLGVLTQDEPREPASAPKPVAPAAANVDAGLPQG